MMNTNKSHLKAEDSTRVKVMIVDDDLRTRKGLRAWLETAHLNPSNAVCPRIAIIGEAANGREALRMVETTKPDVVLMDVQMPVMDGIEATRHIKASWPSVIVIILTIRAQSRAAALGAGADAFLIKGGAMEELSEAVYRSLCTERVKFRK